MNPSRPDYSGMTVNERLWEAGLLDVFDAAIEARDRQAAIDVLVKVDLDARGAAGTVDGVFANPAKYGYPRLPRSH